MDVTVIVATFGDDHWVELAYERAIPSAQAEGVPVVHAHGESLHGARNQGLEQVRSEFVAYLDADDELEPGYYTVMAAGTADVRAPAVRYITNRCQAWFARMPKVSGHDHDCTAECLSAGNWLVVGSLVRAELVRQVGGWRDFAWSEDWDLWIRCWQAGATFEAIPDAVYRAHVRPDSRNRAPQRGERLAAHNAIARANGLEEVPA